MSLVDTLDSILMLYAYAQPDLRTEGKLALFERDKKAPLPSSEEVERVSSGDPEQGDPSKLQPPTYDSEVERVSGDPEQGDPPKLQPSNYDSTEPESSAAVVVVDEAQERRGRLLAAKTATMGSLSISLTLLSIVVALSISLIEIMGLIGENCGRCTAAAEAEDGGGLEGSWWRAWARANDASGYVGAAIVGVFVLILVVYHGARWWYKKRDRKRRADVHAEV